MSNAVGTPAQRIIALALSLGITSTADIAAMAGVSDRAVRKAKAELQDRNSRTGTTVPAELQDRNSRTGTTVPAELQDRNHSTAPGTPVPQTELQYRNSSSDSASRAPAHIELPSEVVLSKKVSKEKGLSKDNPKKPSFGRQQALEAFEAYNATALRCGLPQASRMTPDRERKIIARLKDHGLDGWAKALDSIEHSKFLTGSNDRGWKANLEFLLQASSLAKCIDGSYGNGRKVSSAQSQIDLHPIETEAQIKDRFAKMLSAAVAGCAP